MDQERQVGQVRQVGKGEEKRKQEGEHRHVSGSESEREGHCGGVKR